MSFFQPVDDNIAQTKRNILMRANGKCMCESFRHDHKQPCKRRLYSTFKFVPTHGDEPLNSRNWIAVCSVCARYIKEVGY